MPFDFYAAVVEHRLALAAVAEMAPQVTGMAQLFKHVLAENGKILVCGNGGSAADAQHFAAELTGRFERDRPAYAAIALTTDSSALTSIGNDYGFEHVFVRQLQALARPQDLLLAISTSGNSSNVIRAAEYARAHGIRTAGLLGRDGGCLASVVEQAIIIPVSRTSRIQEMHGFLLHVLCAALET